MSADATFELLPIREKLGEYEVQRAMPGLATALSRAQADLPDIKRTRTAKIQTKSGGSYSYTYADLADIFAAIRSVLAKHELAVTQDVQVRDDKVLCYTTIWHSSGESHSFGPISLAAGSGAQETGSAITYARRYGLSAALGIATEEDDDAQHTSSKKPLQGKPAKVPTTSGPQSGPAPASPHTGRTTPDSKATAAVAPKDGNEKAPRAGEQAAVGVLPDSPPPSSADALRDALKKLHPGNVVWRQREKQICLDHNVDSLEQIDELKLQTEIHNVLSKVKS